MKVAPSEAQVHKNTYRQFLSIPSIQAILVWLLAFCLLAGCTSPASVLDTKTQTTATATPTPSKLIWNDEFDGPKGALPDASKWRPRIGGGGWGNQQLEFNTDNQNVYQDGQGNLVIEARQENPVGSDCWYGPCQYTSAQISTEDHFSFTYGFIEARIKLPAGQGIWPTFWLLDDVCTKNGWQPTCGEIDIMENIGREPNANYGTAHGPEYFSSIYHLPHGVFSDDFHIFALGWDPNHLYFYVDNINYYTIDKTTAKNQAGWVYDRLYYIILNIAVGGKWPGSPDATTVFPQKMYVSYVRLYEH
jgi:beta-glucanase (GH16 family)